MDDPPPPYELAVAWVSGGMPENHVIQDFPIPRNVENLYDNALSTGANVFDNSGGRTGENGDQSGSNKNLQPPPYSMTSFVTSPPTRYSNQLTSGYNVALPNTFLTPNLGHVRYGSVQHTIDGFDSNQPPVIMQPAQQTVRLTSSCHATLACLVFWLCCIVFGGVAYVLAIQADKRETQNPKNFRRLRRASIIVSIMGIVAGATIIAVVMEVTLNVVHCDKYMINGQCFSRRTVTDVDNCHSDADLTYYDGDYCFFNCPTLFYFAGGNCFQHRIAVDVRNGKICGSNSSSISSSCSSIFVANIYYDETYCYFNCAVR